MDPIISSPDVSPDRQPLIQQFESRLTHRLRRPVSRTIMALPLLAVLLSMADPDGANAADRMDVASPVRIVHRVYVI